MDSLPVKTTSVGSPTLTPSPWPNIDFSAFGPIETAPLSRMQSIIAGVMIRNWTVIPHVTHHEEADITALEEARGRIAPGFGTKLTVLSFLVKAVVQLLKAYPKFNGSLDAAGHNFIFKKYFNIGFAVDTPSGLFVPVIRHADSKSLREIANEIVDVSNTARTKGLSFDRMSGGCFTISSLGAIGGTGFTPIINAPEVAILGVCRSVQRPMRVNGQVAWRTMLPLSLSYDHRVINGVDAARFCADFAQALSDPGDLAQL